MEGNSEIILAWWSAGITSAVACKYALEKYPNVSLLYIDIGSANPDNQRFKKDCEKWYNRDILSIKSTKFKDQFDVIDKTGAVNTPYGAPCTLHLKKKVRYEFEDFCKNSGIKILNQVWGYEFKKKEINRAIRHGQQYPDQNPLFPLIEKGLTKNMCAKILLNAGIELPEMYKLGYENNNCIGCVKGGMGYWNKIKIDFPDTFDKMATLERKVGYSCLNGLFLDELSPEKGRKSKNIMADCSSICELEFLNIPDISLESIINKQITIYEAIKSK